MTDPEPRPAVRYGKWSLPGWPHRGWSCEDIEDLGSVDAVCDACEHQEIRYVHTMSHPDWPTLIRAGCICAGHMQEDVGAARQREHTLKNTLRRRMKFSSRGGWRLSARENETIKYRGYRVTVFPQGGGWSFCAHRLGDESPTFAKKPYVGQGETKLAAFDLIVAAERAALGDAE